MVKADSSGQTDVDIGATFGTIKDMGGVDSTGLMVDGTRETGNATECGEKDVSTGITGIGMKAASGITEETVEEFRDGMTAVSTMECGKTTSNMDSVSSGIKIETGMMESGGEVTTSDGTEMIGTMIDGSTMMITIDGSTIRISIDGTIMMIIKSNAMKTMRVTLSKIKMNEYI